MAEYRDVRSISFLPEPQMAQILQTLQIRQQDSVGCLASHVMNAGLQFRLNFLVFALFVIRTPFRSLHRRWLVARHLRRKHSPHRIPPPHFERRQEIHRVAVSSKAVHEIWWRVCKRSPSITVVVVHSSNNRSIRISHGLNFFTFE